MGRFDVDALAAEISSPQLTELIAFERLTLPPWPEPIVNPNGSAGFWGEHGMSWMATAEWDFDD